MSLHCQHLRTLGILGSEVAEVEFQADQTRTLGSEVESQVEFQAVARLAARLAASPSP